MLPKLIEMFHDLGEYHMSNPVFIRHKRWQSISFQEQQKKSSSFQTADLNRSYPAIFADPDSNRSTGAACVL